MQQSSSDEFDNDHDFDEIFNSPDEGDCEQKLETFEFRDTLNTLANYSLNTTPSTRINISQINPIDRARIYNDPDIECVLLYFWSKPCAHVSMEIFTFKQKSSSKQRKSYYLSFYPEINSTRGNLYNLFNIASDHPPRLVPTYKKDISSTCGGMKRPPQKTLVFSKLNIKAMIKQYKKCKIAIETFEPSNPFFPTLKSTPFNLVGNLTTLGYDLPALMWESMLIFPPEGAVRGITSYILYMLFVRPTHNCVSLITSMLNDSNPEVNLEFKITPDRLYTHLTALFQTNDDVPRRLNLSSINHRYLTSQPSATVSKQWLKAVLDENEILITLLADEGSNPNNVRFQGQHLLDLALNLKNKDALVTQLVKNGCYACAPNNRRRIKEILTSHSPDELVEFINYNKHRDDCSTWTLPKPNLTLS